MVRSHSRHSFPAFKMLPCEETTLLTSGKKKVAKKMHTKKTRAMTIEYTAAHARPPQIHGACAAQGRRADCKSVAIVLARFES